MEIIEFPGCRNNSLKFLSNGYVYHADQRNYNLRCSIRGTTKCRGRLELDEDGIIVQRVPHNHRPDPLIITKEQFLSEIFARCRTTFEGFSSIFDAVSRE